MATTTTNLALQKPAVGGDSDAWGGYQNAAFDLIDNEYASQAVADTSATLTSASRIVLLTAAFTSPRTLTLPAASAFIPGQAIVIVDVANVVTATNTLTIARAGSDTINGATSFVVNIGRQAIVLRSDGTSKWTVQSELRQGTFTPTIDFDTTGNLSVVYAVQSGYYTRVGNLCTVFVYLRCTPTFTTASGDFLVKTLPVTPNTANQIALSAMSITPNFSGFTGISGVIMPFLPQAGGTSVHFVTTGNHSGDLATTNLTSAAEITIGFTLAYTC